MACHINLLHVRYVCKTHAHSHSSICSRLPRYWFSRCSICARMRIGSLACTPIQSTLQGREKLSVCQRSCARLSQSPLPTCGTVCAYCLQAVAVCDHTRTAARLSACRRSDLHAVCVCDYCAACSAAIICKYSLSVYTLPVPFPSSPMRW